MPSERAQVLAALEGQRLRWKGTISRWSQKKNKKDRRGITYTTILLTDMELMDGKERVEFDHTWVQGGAWHHGLKVGDTIIFNATVVPYHKGDPNNAWDKSNLEIDYKLHRVNTVVKVRK